MDWLRLDFAWFTYTIALMAVTMVALTVNVALWVLASRRDCLAAGTIFFLYMLDTGAILFDEYLRTKPVTSEYFDTGLTHPVFQVVVCCLLVSCVWLWCALRMGEDGMKILHELEESGDLTLRINCVPTCASDGPVTSFNPLEEMEAGITRNSPFPGEEDTDMHRWADQALTPYELLQAYTTNVTFQNFYDDKVGTIEVGKRADLVCLDTNIVTCDPKLISDSKVLYTISDDRVVFEG